MSDWMRPLVMDYLARAWREPDEGIWEVRGGPQHFVYSKVMAWLAFDRAVGTVATTPLVGRGERQLYLQQKFRNRYANARPALSTTGGTRQPRILPRSRRSRSPAIGTWPC